jgi:hypothetical protein
MPSTYTLIKGETIGSAAASYTFTAIPSIYTDLLLRWSARCDTTTENVDIQLNAATTNYSLTQLDGYGSSGVASSRLTAGLVGIRVYGMTNSGNTANTFGSAEFYLPNYAGSTNKPNSTFAVTETNATVALIQAVAGLRSNTDPVTSLRLSTGSGNFVSGSSFYLYGIKNS